MRRFALKVSLLTAVVAVFLYVSPVYAHPGNTDSNGCHTCRTNCTERWGIPYGFYHRHSPVRPCFETANSTPTPYIVPTKGVVVPSAPPATPTTTPWPTIEPTVITPTPTHTPAPTDNPPPATPTDQAVVLGESASSGGTLGVIVGIIGFVVVFWRAVNQKWPFHPKI